LESFHKVARKSEIPNRFETGDIDHRMKLIFITLCLLVMGAGLACRSPNSVNEYGSIMMKAFERQSETRGECEKTLDQVCLTKSIEKLQDTIKTSTSLAPTPMSVAHERLYSIVSEMVVLNRLSENPENLTPEFIERNISIIEEFMSALEEWVSAGEKLSAE
jgi:hypothetical protein